MADKRIKDLPAFSGTVPNNAVFAMETNAATQKVDLSALRAAIGPVGSKRITENGEYTAADDNLYGFNEVEVDVQGTGGRVTQGADGKLLLSEDGSIVAEVPITITTNGTTTPPDGYAFSAVITDVSGGGGGINIPVSMAVTTQPTKASYATGETLDLTGIVVTATYADGTIGNVTSGCTFSPANGTTLSTAGTVIITATYSVTDTSSGHNYTVTLTATTTVSVSVVSGVRAKRGDSGTIVSLSGLYGPMGDAHADYFIPIDANGNDVTIDNTQPFEIKVTFRITQYPQSADHMTDANAFEGKYGGSYTYLPCIIWMYLENFQAYVAQIYWSSGAINLGDTNTPASLNEDIEIVFSYDGTDMSASLDIGTYHTSGTYAGVTFPATGSDSCFYAGTNTSSAGYEQSLARISGAYMNIDKCYIKQNGTLIWGVAQS